LVVSDLHVPPETPRCSIGSTASEKICERAERTPIVRALVFFASHHAPIANGRVAPWSVVPTTIHDSRQISLTRLFKNEVPTNNVARAWTEEAAVLESDRYKQYAADCIRLAETMNAKDKQILLEIAAAWNARAQEAGRKEKNSGSTRSKREFR